MGFFTNLFAAAAVNQYNQSRNHVASHHFDFLPVDGNLILCGGQKGRLQKNGSYQLTFAEEIKLAAFSLSMQQAVTRNQGAVCLYSAEHFPTPDIPALNIPQERMLQFGINASYLPLDSDNITKERASLFFQRIIHSYSKRHQANAYVLSSVMQMLLFILEKQSKKHSVGSYITLSNLKELVSPMSISQIAFEQSVESLTDHLGFQIENFLTLSWDSIVREFLPFWNDFCCALPTVPDATEFSLYTAMLENYLCLFRISSGNQMLKEILISEMAMLNEKLPHYHLIDYYVSLEQAKEYDCFQNQTIRLIGDSFRNLGISEVFMPEPAILCLGVNASDAQEIIDKTVSTNTWLQTTFGLGNGGHVDFTSNERKPITPAMLSLSQIPDGSAYRIDRTGFLLIRNLL